MIVTNKALGAKQVQITFQNNTAVAQVLTPPLDMTWPQLTNGNLTKITMNNGPTTTIYNTSTGGGTLHATTLLGTPAQRTIAANGGTATVTFNFASNVDLNANNYTGSATFNPFGTVTYLP